MTKDQEAMSAAIDSINSGLFHLKQSGLDEEGKMGKAQIESAVLNLRRRLDEALMRTQTEGGNRA